MYDVIFSSQARLGDQNQPSTPDYCAQDFETLLAGPVVPLTFDAQSGSVFLGLDFITPAPITFNPFDSQDFEAMTPGVVPATGIPVTTFLISTVPLVALKVGVITPATINFASDDIESYVAGTVPAVGLTQALNGGGAILGTGVFYPRFGGIQ